MSGGKKGGESRPVPAPLPGAPEFGADTPELLNQQALSSILNTSNVFGSSGVTGSAEEGFTKETQLSPELQALYSKILDPSAGEQYGQAYFDRASSLLEPGRETQAKQEDVNLAARGLPVGSELRSDIESASARQRNEADDRLALTSILQGEQQQSRDVGEFLNLASGVESAQGPNINTLASYQLPYQAEVLPYMQQIQRDNMQFGADTAAYNQDAAAKQAEKEGLLSGAGQIGAAALFPPAAPMMLAAGA